MAITIQELWDLRKELDHAITTKQYDQISKIKSKYKSMVDETDFLDQMFTSYNYEGYSKVDIQKHNFANMKAILRNIQAFEKKHVKGEDVSVKLQLPHSSPCLGSEIWVIRAMYDKFLAQGKKTNLESWKVQGNMLLGQAVQNRLKDMIFMIQTEKYCDKIFPLLHEVREGYVGIYGKAQPKTSYSQIAEDYQENKNEEEQ